MTDYRAVVDVDLTFLNGGGLRANKFRLDISSPEITQAEIGDLLVRHLGLLMVDQVNVTAMRIVREQHKGTRYPGHEDLGPLGHSTGRPGEDAGRLSQRARAGGPEQSPHSQGLLGRGTGKRRADRSRKPNREPSSFPSDVGSTSPARSTRMVELSHSISAGMITYPGLPGPEITPYLTRQASRERYAEGTEFAIDWIRMVGNTGTYLDSPFHRYADGIDLAGLPLDAVADLPALVVRLTDAGRAIGREALVAHDVEGAAVLLHTGWDRNWSTEAYGTDAPYLTEGAARFLAEAGARLVGIDSVNIDSVDGDDRPAYSILLGAGIPILEHLTGLGEVPVTGARLHAAPPPVEGFGTFPVRAYALVPSKGMT
jgi:arylformamidase